MPNHKLKGVNDNLVKTTEMFDFEPSNKYITETIMSQRSAAIRRLCQNEPNKQIKHNDRYRFQLNVCLNIL